MNCHVCGGALENRSIEICLCEGQPAKIAGVPALVCQQCGEETLSPDTLRRLEAMKPQLAGMPDSYQLMKVFEFEPQQHRSTLIFNAALVAAMMDDKSTGWHAPVVRGGTAVTNVIGPNVFVSHG